MIDSWYAVNVAQEIKRGLYAAAKQGTHTGGVPPYGYKIKELPNGKKIYEIDPATAPIVRGIFRMVLGGYSYRKIIQRLESLGIKPSRGSVWRKSSIYTILRNPVYYGARALGRRPKSKNGRKRISQDKWLIVENAHEPIISKEEWLAVQRHSKRSYYVRSDSRAILGGLLYCAKCGSKMWHKNVTKYKKDYFIYICSKKLEAELCSAPSISAEKLERLVLEEISNIIGSYTVDDILNKIQDTEDKRKKLQVEISNLHSLYEKNTQGIKNLIASIEELGYLQSIKERITELNNAQENIKAEIDKKEEELAQLKAPSKEELEEALQILKEQISNGLIDKSSTRKLISTLVDKIVVDTENRVIQLTVKIPDVASTIWFVNPLVPQEGIEPPTRGLGVPCSIH